MIIFENTKKTACSSGIYSAGSLIGAVGNFGNGLSEGAETFEKNSVHDIE